MKVFVWFLLFLYYATGDPRETSPEVDQNLQCVCQLVCLAGKPQFHELPIRGKQ